MSRPCIHCRLSERCANVRNGFGRCNCSTCRRFIRSVDKSNRSEKHYGDWISQERQITVNLQRNSGAGKFADYFKISNDVGVKVVGSLKRDSKHNTLPGFNSIKEMLDDKSYLKKVIQECSYLKTLSDSKMTPRFVNWSVVNRNNKFYLAIIMEHLGDVTASKEAYERLYQFKAIRKLRHSLVKKYGIHWNDFDETNTVIKGNKIYFIDMSPELVRHKSKQVHNNCTDLINEFKSYFSDYEVNIDLKDMPLDNATPPPPETSAERAARFERLGMGWLNKRIPPPPSKK